MPQGEDVHGTQNVLYFNLYLNSANSNEPMYIPSIDTLKCYLQLPELVTCALFVAFLYKNFFLYVDHHHHLIVIPNHATQ